ncbi:alpha/beta hydrolase family protein [Pseudonocardia sp. CA-107938]|uniref:alpha/beta hydrolase n=1 Tax=Pseudonocardia sp. CA-107938 TaxID=3240021 RepID=UPI003D8ECF32
MLPDFPTELTPRADTAAVRVRSAGLDLPGVLHLPAGPGPHPVVLVLHGFPGFERNFDLAHYLRRSGYATLVFHYRGSWGSAGTWSWAHVLQDCTAAVEWVRSVADAHRLDPTAVALVGHSLGGFAALQTAAADGGVRAVASIAGFDLGAAARICRDRPDVAQELAAAFDAFTLPLSGTSGDALVAELSDAGAAWELTALGPALADRPVLLVGAGHDTDAPVDVHHAPLVDALSLNRTGPLHHHVLPTDHALSDHRVALGEIVRDLLVEEVPPAPRR